MLPSCLKPALGALLLVLPATGPDRIEKHRAAEEIQEVATSQRSASYFAQPVTWTTPTAILDAMSEKLNLGIAQIESARRLLTEYRSNQVKIRRGLEPSREETGRSQQLLREIVLARESEDTEQAEKLMEELRILRARQDDRKEALYQQLFEAQTTLYHDLRDLLTEDQYAEFDLIWRERIVPHSRNLSDVHSHDQIKAAVSKLDDLTSEQVEKLDKLFKTYVELLRAVREETGTRNQLITGIHRSRLHQAVMAVLTPSQRERFENNLEKVLQDEDPSKSPN